MGNILLTIQCKNYKFYDCHRQNYHNEIFRKALTTTDFATNIALESPFLKITPTMSPLKVNSSNKENVKVDVSKLKALSTHDTAKDPLKLKTNTLQPNSKSTKTPQKFKIHEDPNSKSSSTKKDAVTKSTSEHQGTQTKLTGPDLMDFTE